jgi:hypothetical protein
MPTMTSPGAPVRTHWRPVTARCWSFTAARGVPSQTPCWVVDVQGTACQFIHQLAPGGQTPRAPVQDVESPIAARGARSNTFCNAPDVKASAKLKQGTEGRQATRPAVHQLGVCRCTKAPRGAKSDASVKLMSCCSSSRHGRARSNAFA